MSDRYSELSDEALGRRLASDLPRHAAPARLRVAIVDATERRVRDCEESMSAWVRTL